jgi:hypothetical protein
VIDADYWREPGTKFRERAMATKDDALLAELLELAQVCDEVAGKNRGYRTNRMRAHE